jgi:hypothetical protein
MTLNTFHQSGSSKNVSFGIEALKELFHVSEERKNYNMAITFNNCDLTYDGIFDLRNELVEITLGSIIKQYEYIPASQEKPKWTDGFLYLTKQYPLPEHKWSLRLVLDVNRMLSYKVSISKIIQMIRDKAPPNIVVVPSPIALGILDLYPNENDIESDFGENSTLMFLSVSVLPVIQQFILSGVEGIEALFPVNIPVLSIIQEEILVKEGDNKFYLSFSRAQMKKTGISYKQVQRLLDYVGIKTIKLEPDNSGMFVEMPTEKKSGVKIMEYPMKYVKSILDKEQKDMDKLEEDKKKDKIRGFIAPSSRLMKASQCWTAETNGKNFLDVIKLPQVDPYHTYSNDFHEIASLLGIEAVRNLLVIELRNVLLRDEYINPRHIGLLTDVMTNLGRLTPISFYGAMRFGPSTLSLASNQQSLKVFQNSAAFTKKESVNSVSAAMMLGKLVPMGTGGSFSIIEKTPIPPPQPAPAELSDTIDNLQNEMNTKDEDQDIASMETNQAYNSFMFGSNPSRLYASKKDVPAKGIPYTPSESKEVPSVKTISPIDVKVLGQIKSIPVFGEDVELKSISTQPPQEIINKNESVLNIEKAELEREPELMPPPKSKLVPPSLPAKKKVTVPSSISQIMSMASKIPPKVPTPKKQLPTKDIDVEKGISLLNPKDL